MEGLKKKIIVSISNMARKSFSGKITAKVDFPIGHFILPLL